MAQVADVRIEGARELARSLRAVDKGLPKEMARIHKRVAEPVADKARAKAPKRTGRLASSIKAYGTQRAAAIGAGARLPPYAGVIEYGWPRHRIVGKHYLTSALHESQGSMLATYEIELDDFIGSVWQSIT